MSLKNQWYQFWLSVLAHVLVQSQDIEACHSFGKPDIDKFQEAISCVSWKKNCKKVLFNKKKLSSIDNSKDNFYTKHKKFCQPESDNHEWVNFLQLQKVEA